MLKKKVDLKLLILLSFSFIIFIAAGTISHEFGHIVVAKTLGYDTILHYGNMNFSSKILPYKEIGHLDKLLIYSGGILQTIFIGLSGLGMILFSPKKLQPTNLNLSYWIPILLALFWLRMPLNIVLSFGDRILKSEGDYFTGDEATISTLLGLPVGTISIVLGIIGLLISYYIVLKIIPKKIRFTFILSGLIGGCIGFYLWMHLWGPKILP